MKTVALHNLGCKVNSYELEVMQQMLQEKGYEIVSFDEIADIYIVNTCTVTNIADRKSRQMLHRAKQLNPKAIVVAVGCYVQTGKEAIEKDDSIDLAIGNNRKKDIAVILEEYLQQIFEKNAADSDTQKPSPGKTMNGQTVLDINHTYEYEEMKLYKTAEHTRAYIKIQDGCNQFCSYCAIPYARGRVRSRHVEDILEEVEGLAKRGYLEIVLTGIHISSYGIDFEEEQWKLGNSVENQKGERLEYRGESKLIDLIEKIHSIEGIKRIRLGSLEPRIVTEETAARLAALWKVCPHFHLSLQSGCDDTLKRMNRHYTTEEYFRSVEYLRRAYQNPAITTDVIVGFPGETQEEFERTKAFLTEISFYEMHIFKYSKREGTVAARMKEQIPEQTKTVRSNQLLLLEKEQSGEFREKLIGRLTEVLWEETKEIEGKEWVLGHTTDYVKVAVLADLFAEQKVNFISKVKVKGFLTDTILLGERIVAEEA